MAGSALSPFSGFGPGLGEYRVVMMSRRTGWASLQLIQMRLGIGIIDWEEVGGGS